MGRVKIKIAFDIGILSRLCETNCPESGLARASRNLLCALLKREDTDIRIVTCESPHAGRLVAYRSGWSKRYIAPNGRAAQFVSSVCLALDCHIHCQITPDSLLGRLWKSLVFRISHRLKSSTNSLVDRDTMEWADIYQSSYLAFPDMGEVSKKPVKFAFIHDLIALKFPEWFDDHSTTELKRILASIDGDTWVIANSTHTKKDFLDYTHHPTEKVKVSLLAADRKLFTKCDDITKVQAIRNHLSLKEDQPYLLSLCTLEPRKNLDKVIEAWSLAVEEYGHRNLALVLAGAKGWRTEGMEQMLSKVRNKRHLILLPGFIPDDQLAALYSGAKAFIYLSKYEGFGLPPLEAMQCGTPVITSNSSSIPEVVGDAAIMVDCNAPRRVALHIDRLCSEPEYAETLSRMGLERSAQFSWDKCADRFVASYREALAASH